MRPGTLRHRIAIDAPARVQGPSGEVVDGWSTLAMVWGSIEPSRAPESERADQVLGDMDTLVRIRWSPKVSGISPAWRLRHQTTIYDIKSVANVRQANREFELMCKSGRNRG